MGDITLKKSLLNLTFMALLTTAGSAAMAGPLPDGSLIDFTSNTPALAAEVNTNFADVETAVDDNDGRITTNAAGIATNVTGIATNGTAAATNASGITTNTGNITSNAGGITTNAGGITTNAGNITSNAGGITTNAGNITTNAGGITTNTGNVTTNAGGITTNAGGITTNAGGITTNATDIATNVTDIATNVTNIATNTTNITALQAANACPSDMVAVGSLCVDLYEASVWSAAIGGTQIEATADSGTFVGATGACAADGSDCGIGEANPVYARSVSGVKPAHSINLYQASVACANVGKRLPTISEWQMAAFGTPANGGGGAAACNGSGALGNTGTAGTNCQSTAGTFDMVGNVYELTADLIFAFAGGDTATTTDVARVVAMGDDYGPNGTTNTIKDVSSTGPSDTGNFTTGFRCVK
jgi:Sulfatase-modifying factor enzyme 1